MEYIKKFDKTTESIFFKYLKHPVFVQGIINLLLLLYATKVAPELPPKVLQWLNNEYIKLLIFVIILVVSNVSPSVALMIAISFMVTLNYLNKKPLWEFLENVENTQVVAQTKEEAVKQTVDQLQAQAVQTPIVQTVSQQQPTIVVQPSIVQTPDGKQSVVNPSVVIAPAVVSSESGQKVVVTPDVTVVKKEDDKKEKNIYETESGCFPSRKYDISKVVGNNKDHKFSKFVS
jgi:hypothetical protein